MSDSEQRELPLTARLEALLFVASQPAAPAELADALGIGPKTVEAGLDELEILLGSSGLRLQRHAGRFQLTTAPELAANIERFLGLEARSHLSRPALETLAIVAYNQPVTRPQIDAVRGRICFPAGCSRIRRQGQTHGVRTHSRQHRHRICIHGKFRRYDNRTGRRSRGVEHH